MPFMSVTSRNFRSEPERQETLHTGDRFPLGVEIAPGGDVEETDCHRGGLDDCVPPRNSAYKSDDAKREEMRNVRSRDGAGRAEQTRAASRSNVSTASAHRTTPKCA
jgi:hypothetical protein